MSVTVVIPTFNRLHMLERAIKSVLAQTLEPDEIIVVDDGSEDATVELLSEKYKNILFLSQENAGVSAARNRGIRHAKSQWLAFLDSDDEWLPQKLEKQVKALEKNKNYNFCHCNEIWLREGRTVKQKKKHLKKGGEIFEDCLPLCMIGPSTVLMHTQVFENIGYFDESFEACEDYDYWLRYAARYPVLLVEDELVIKYGGHSDQLSSRVWGLDRFRIKALKKIILEQVLNSEKSLLVLKMMEEKISIFIEGAKNRNSDYATIFEADRVWLEKQMAQLSGCEK